MGEKLEGVEGKTLMGILRGMEQAREGGRFLLMRLPQSPHFSIPLCRTFLGAGKVSCVLINNHKIGCPKMDVWQGHGLLRYWEIILALLPQFASL